MGRTGKRAEKVEPETLKEMQMRGGTWAAYQNHDMGHSNLGHIVCLQYGPGCTFETPPERMPDSPRMGVMWRYGLIGTVNMGTGEIEPKGGKDVVLHAGRD